jgi:hypothetical protein
MPTSALKRNECQAMESAKIQIRKNKNRPTHWHLFETECSARRMEPNEGLDVDLYTVKKSARPRLPAYSG